MDTEERKRYLGQADEEIEEIRIKTKRGLVVGGGRFVKTKISSFVH